LTIKIRVARILSKNKNSIGGKMRRNAVKIMLIVLMLAGICFAAFNFLAVETEARVIWQKLEMGEDPVSGGTYIRCFETGEGCVTVYPNEP
jgi:hypothetical protein